MERPRITENEIEIQFARLKKVAAEQFSPDTFFTHTNRGTGDMSTFDFPGAIEYSRRYLAHGITVDQLLEELHKMSKAGTGISEKVKANPELAPTFEETIERGRQLLGKEAVGRAHPAEGRG
jgi:hypothetical protein